jgi:multimeric flavodoxin WrbA
VVKALILDGSREGDSLTPVAVSGMCSALEGRGVDVEHVKLRGFAVAPCTGCFGCWTRTPGECVFEDATRDVVRSYVMSDIVVYATPVTFGGYSSLLKAILDRIILPVLDPRFTVVGGEVHHRLRYRRYPMTIGLGTLRRPDPEAERLFSALVARNGLNIQRSAEAGVMVGVTDPASARAIAERLLARAGIGT